MFKAFYLEVANRDIDEIADYFGSIDPDLGVRFISAVQGTVEEICLYPAVTRWRKVGGTLVQMRVVNGFRRHLICYRTLSDRVEILRVIHGSRDQESAFRQN